MTSSTPERPHFPVRGVAFGLAAAACLSLQDAIIKLLAGDYHILQIIFARAGVGAMVAAGIIYYASNFSALRPSRPLLVAARVCFMTIATLCYYISLTFLDLTAYTCLGLTVFLFIAALSGPILKEKTSGKDWAAVAVGLSGALIVVNPFAAESVYLPAALLLLFGAFMWALGLVATRALGVTMSAAGILFYTNAAVMMLAVIAQPFVWQTPSASDAMLFLMLSTLGACGQGCAIAAYRNARVSAVMPTQHTMLLWAALLAWLLWDEIPELRVWFGGALIVGASLSALPKPRRRRNNRAKNRV